MKEYNPIVQKEVISFLAEFCSVKSDQITIESDIVRDLNIEGDDAKELVEKFGEKFSVNVTSFKVDDYFVPESYFNPLIAFWKFVMGSLSRPKTIRVKDLIDSVDRGVLS